jgi:hypothetical protein
MTTIATGLTGPLETSDAPVVERRPQRSAGSDAGPGDTELLGAPVLRSSLDRDTGPSEAVR